MGSPTQKKLRISHEYEQDRISTLPDELIHRILSFVDAIEAVQTSALSKRWKLIWTTLPFLNFGWYKHSSHHIPYMFIHHVLSNRDHASQLSELKLCVSGNRLPGGLLERFVIYANSHNVQYLNLDLNYEHRPYKLSNLSSKSLKKLTLRLKPNASLSDCWNLPVLTTLHLVCPSLDAKIKFPISCLTCLPALRTLCLDNWNLSQSAISLSLPDLMTLRLYRCTLPQTVSVWNFPSLLSLDLCNVSLPENLSDVFSTLVKLQNLTLSLPKYSKPRNHLISFPQLLNLNICASRCIAPLCSFVVMAPKLCNFSSIGIFSITFGDSRLENVNVKLQGWIQNMDLIQREKYYLQFTNMLSGLGNAENLTFDSHSIQALSEISNLLVSFPSPFSNLKFMKLPRGSKELSISSAVKSYLLGGSPRAITVTTLPQVNMIPRTATVFMTAENAAVEEPSEALTKGLVDCQYIDNTMSAETVNVGVEKKHALENSLVDANGVRQTDSSSEGTSNNQRSSFEGNIYYAVWRGHEVNSEFVCLLERIMRKYPETFEHFKKNKLSTVWLNMLCTSLNAFTKLSMTEVNFETIVQYKDIFAYLQNLGFNIGWVLSRLNYIQHLRFSKPLIMELHAIDCLIDDAKSEVQDLPAPTNDAISKLRNLQSLRAEKMTEIEKDFGTMGTNLAVGFIADDLLSGP